MAAHVSRAEFVHVEPKYPKWRFGMMQSVNECVLSTEVVRCKVAFGAIEPHANPCDAYGGRWELEPGRVVDITSMTASILHDAISLIPQCQLK